MEVKKDILWRVYMSFLGIVVFSVVIMGRAVYIQQAQGSYWREQAKEQQQKFVEIDAQRGTIYSEDGRMLSTSTPYFDIYIDFAAEGLRDKNGARFENNLDSLSLGLATMFPEKSRASWRRELKNGYQKKNRYYLLKKNLTFQQYKQLRSLPLVREGKNKSGFIADVKDKRLNPFGLLANRTIGLSREYIDSGGIMRNMNVGLEKTYDDQLRGESGKRLMRKIAAGVFVPVDGSEIEPQSGKDIITTLDVNIQDITENALLNVLTTNECEYGTCIVMEVATGKIKAIANLSRREDGNYWENFNYAIQTSEPGSTFKLATMLSLLEDQLITLQQHINLEGGSWNVNGRTVYDTEDHGTDATIKHAFELSSNVGMAKLAMTYYGKNPTRFVNHIKKLHFDQQTGIDLLGEANPVIKTPKSKTWSATSLPWMSFGYEVMVSPLQTLMLYNAVANGGTMMKPYLVNEVQENGVAVHNNQPQVVEESICSAKTLKLLRECLEGVCINGTAAELFRGAPYSVAAKTGTALMANGNKGYSEHIYQSSFAGYFPADHPQYSCIVVIRNKPFAPVYYGAKIAGPVFKEIADKLYAQNSDQSRGIKQLALKKDSSNYLYAGASEDIKEVLDKLNIKYRDSAKTEEWARMYAVNYQPVISNRSVANKIMPDMHGMGLKDALFLLENRKMKVVFHGRGKVSSQSIEPGTYVSNHQTVTLELN
ncbi:peptidoglycan glycosyltransferase [Niastella vici]|uniref:Peptidoglycan glycosyltransferase n=1 Tax=Niastella vici TaxID=1703345 RepID=A0A1V9FSN5_9BACT|nr:penicillin-binding protein [Niastella vici]OQP61375.1 peptidoglycan glycosyltransferase [Niastella vici]